MKENEQWTYSKPAPDKTLTEPNNQPIQLDSCPQNGKNCATHREKINECLVNSFHHFSHREYDFSINELKIAFDKTKELEKSTCTSCAKLFRTRITASMEQIHDELHKMTTGLFKSKRYKPSFEYATVVIQEFKENI
ncbi:hypothetical protein [uncultured Sunxiuqinia sp.]|uniref:hypothetical protein n=1 Tax=uncultured Sunxiuqinia sp. TaxID=1573825 RepID=UPI002607E6A7|nr:hypothetical protein [uncultured Sunxiuqinia sp.]